MSCEINHKPKGEITITIGDKVFLFLNDRDFLFDEEMHLDLSLEERRILLEEELKYIAFFFGGRMYWASFNPEYYLSNRKTKVEFNEFKYIGEPVLAVEGMPWAHLGVHSEYELNNGNHNAEKWIAKAKFLKCSALGICDYNTLGGTLSFQLACEKSGVKSIIGMSTQVLKEDGYRFGCKLYCKNRQGWQNLLKINKRLHVDLEADYVEEDFILKHSKGLVFVFGLFTPPAPNDEHVEITQTIAKFKASFEDCFWQLDTVEYKSDQVDLRVLNNLKLFYRQTDLKPILLADSYYIDQEYAPLKLFVNKSDGVVHPESDDQYFKTLDDHFSKLSPLFGDDGQDAAADLMIDAIANTQYVADSCDFKINTGQHKLPKYEVVSLSEAGGNKREQQRREKQFWIDRELDHGDFDGLFFQLISQGWEKKLGHLDERQRTEYFQRLETETNVIVPAGFIHYFLILWDIVAWCKHPDQNIIVGSGRGSVVGSLIAYLLDITTVDPLPYGLLFERFLNETRAMPEQWYEICLDNDDIRLFIKDSPILLTNGETVLVQDLNENDDIDFNFFQTKGKQKGQ